MRPVLASQGTAIPRSRQWVHEVNWGRNARAGRCRRWPTDRAAGLSIDTSPFADDVPPTEGRGAVWVRPEILAEVRSLGLSAGAKLRQPACLGLRPDLTPDDLFDPFDPFDPFDLFDKE